MKRDVNLEEAQQKNADVKQKLAFKQESIV